MSSSSAPTPGATVQPGRFPLPTAVFCSLWLAFIVGFLTMDVLSNVLCKPLFDFGLELSVAIGTAAGVAVAIPVFIWALMALRQPRFRPVRTGWIAIAGASLVGGPVGVLTGVGVQELATAYFKGHQDEFGIVAGLLVGFGVAFAFNTWALRRCARRYAPIG